MNPQNFVTSKLTRATKYTDGSDSREVEDWDDEETKKFNEGFAYRKPPSILDIRDKLINIIDLTEVVRMALDKVDSSQVKISNVLYFSVIMSLEEIEKELARL